MRPTVRKLVSDKQCATALPDFAATDSARACRGAGTARSTSKGPGRRDSNTSFRDPHQVHGHRVTRILEIPPKTETVQLKTELLDDWKAYVNIASRGGPAEHVQTLKASLSYDPSKALVPGSGCWAAALLKHKAVMV